LDVNRAEPRPAGENRLLLLWLALVCLAALWTFKAALGFEFIAIDDSGNITLNPHMGPPGAWNLHWMFTDVDYVRRYIPLGWLGFSTVFAIFGLSAQGYHAANLALHVANTALLYWLLVTILRRWGRDQSDSWTLACAGLATALWALHPFRAESIGWISGMLYGQAGFFALISVLAYLRAVTHPAGSAGRWAWLAATALGYLASLLTYPIAIGLVAGYFVIDYADGRPFRILREKWLLVLPAALVASVTVAVRFHANSMWPAAPALSEFPVVARVMQGFYVFAYYLWKTLGPSHLTPAPTDLYEFDPLAPLFLASAVLVLGLTVALCLRPAWRRGPLLLWVVYLALLIPIAGYTEHPHYPNDRYSYLPGMVMAAAVALGLARVSRAGGRAGVVIIVAAVAGASAWAARRQLGIWRNSDTVFISIIEGTPNAVVRKQNFVRWAHANANLGKYATSKAILAERQREYPDSALTDRVEQGRDAPRADSPFDQDHAPLWSDQPPEAAGNLKIALEAARAERTVEAEAHFQRSLAIAPDYRDAQYNYAMFLALHGRPRQALHLYFILSTGKVRPGFAGQGRLLSVIAASFWSSGDAANARSSLARAFSGNSPDADAALSDTLRSQAKEYGVQTLPALRDSTIR
jgi:protein O-mannosyl-transferase